MSAFESEMVRRLDEIARRVERLEDFRSRAEGVLPPTAAERSAPRPETPPIADLALLRPPHAKPQAGTRSAWNHAEGARRSSGPVPLDEPRAALTAPRIERFIGGRWLAASGALIVVVGVGLFLKLAYDLGWFGALSPTMKCALGGGFGVALLLAGEAVRRAIHRLGSVGLFAAGLGTLYASAFAAHAHYGLVGSTGAMLMLTACVALGVGIGALAGLASVAIISLLGGYMTPLLLADSHAHAWFMPSYLLVLLGIALTLSAWKSPRAPWFDALRTLAWWGTMILGTFWIFEQHLDEPVLCLVFVAIVWVATHAERYIASARTDSSDPRRPGLRVALADARMLAGSISTTAWTMLFSTAIVDLGGLAPMWHAPALAAIVAAMIAALSAGRLRVLTVPPRTRVERLSACLAIQAGALALMAIGLAFEGWLRALALLSFGVASVITARWIRSVALDVYGMIALAISSLFILGGQLMILAGEMSEPVVLAFGGIKATDWSWRVALCACAWLTSSAFMLMHGSARASIRAAWSAAAGALALMLVFAHPRSALGSLAAYWGIIGVLAAMTPIAVERLRLRELAACILSAGAFAWYAAYPGRGWGATASTFSVHPGLFIALALAAAFVIAGRRASALIADAPARSAIRAAGYAAAGAMTFVSTSYEVARQSALAADDWTVQRAAVSIYWGLFSIALLLAGVRWRSAAMRYFGLALINIAAAKTVFVDLDGVAPPWRIASFIGLGLLMIGTAVGYSKFGGRAGDGAAAGVPPGDSSPSDSPASSAST